MKTTNQEVKIPTVYLPQRVLDAIADETLAHPRTETGQAFVGIELDDALFILGTIPDIVDTVRLPGFFRLGGQDQVEIFRWLNLHWEAMKQGSHSQDQPGWTIGKDIPLGSIPPELDLPLSVVGYWHRHPGDFRDLSSTDMRQVNDMLNDPMAQRTQVLAPIVTYDRQERLIMSYDGDDLILRSVIDEMRITFHYFQRGVRLLVKPIIVPDTHVPWLPPLPWHLADLKRMRTELALLKQAGYKVRWQVREMDGDPVQEIIFALDREDWNKRLVLVTDWDYPESRPRILEFPKDPSQAPATQATEANAGNSIRKGESLLKWLRRLMKRQPQDLFQTDRPVQRLPWDKNLYLVDLVAAHEAQEGGPHVGSGSETPG